MEKLYNRIESKTLESLTVSPNLCCRSSIERSFSSISNASEADGECYLSASSIQSTQSDVSNKFREIFNLKTKNPNNPLIGFLNINSLRNKMIDLRKVVKKCLPDILVIEETKLNSGFKTENFLINNYQKPIRHDRNEFGGGLMHFFRKGVVCNRVPAFESLNNELICPDLLVCKKKWIILAFTDPQKLQTWNYFSENCLFH